MKQKTKNKNKKHIHTPHHINFLLIPAHTHLTRVSDLVCVYVKHAYTPTDDEASAWREEPRVGSCGENIVVEDDVADCSGTAILFVSIVGDRRVGALLCAYTSSHSSSFTTRHRIHIGENIA